MKKMIKLLTCIYIFIPIFINARTNYEDAVRYANNYIYNFDEYTDYIYIDNNIPFVYENNKNNIDSNFKSGGFLSRREYEISNAKGNSYLSNGLQYWTLTKSSHLKHYIVDYKLVEQIDTNLSGVRITEFTKPDVIVSGTGTYGNPWTFDEVLSIHINSDNIIRGKVSTVECSNENMKKESIHLNVVGNNSSKFYVCPEEGYKFLQSTCSKYITNHNMNNMYTVDDLDRDNVICKISYSYVTKEITVKGCTNCLTGKTDRIIYVNNTHKVWLEDINGTQKIETIDNLPTKTGYTFQGYYTEDTYENKIIDIDGKLIYNEQLNSKDEAYPYMKANEYTVKYNCNNGEGTTEQSEHTYDVSSNLTSNGCTRKGYKFEGWSTTKTGSKKYNNRESVKNLTSENNGTVTLYAVWTECPKGTYGENGTTCTKCLAGTYNSNTASISSSACKDCVSGTYSSEGSSSCTKCEVGTYSPTIAATSSSTCLKCDLGYYASSKGSSSCTKCPKGTYANKKGLSECVSCPTGYTSPEGSDNANDCYVASSLPTFTYSGKYELMTDNDVLITSGNNTAPVIPNEYKTYTGNWKLRFLTGGELTINSLPNSSKIDIFLVGGGQGGSKGDWEYTGSATYYRTGSGGKGGYRKTYTGIEINLGTSYDVVVGSGGGSSGKAGGDSTFTVESTVYKASSGSQSGVAKAGVYEFESSSYSKKYGGGGGYGCECYSYSSYICYGGTGKDGGGTSGNSGWVAGSTGTTCTSSRATYGTAGEPNTGGGGGGGGSGCGNIERAGSSGGSGIVIIRNAR